MMNSSKPGPSSVDQASKGSCPSHNSGGSPGRSVVQMPIPGPESTGGPVALKKALMRKSIANRGRNSPGRY